MGETSRTLACPECRKPCLRGSKFCAHCGTLLSSLEPDLVDRDGALPPGTLVGGYRLIEVLGEGGMGRVYVAEHLKLGRRVAIKKLRRELVSNPGSVARFFAEARAVNRIFHENIVEITDMIEQSGGDNCIVMELLKGEDLAHRLHRAGPLPLVSAFGIAAQIASALAAVHAAGMIHRDLKPDNIFLIERAGNPDFVKVLDFGVAKLSGADDRGGIAMHTTAAGQIIGTPEYMSPEQARGEPVDARADIYALGVIVYEMITGALPVPAKSFGELMIKHLTAPVELPSHQPGLAPGIQAGRDRLLLDLLAKNPADRPTSMADVERRLRELVDAMMLGSRPDPVRPSAAARAGAEAVAKLALVKRQTPLAAVEIATPRSVSRIDVLTPSSIRLDSIAKLLPPVSEPEARVAVPSAERLAKSSSDAHAPVPPNPSGLASAGPGRAAAEPGRAASAPGARAAGATASGTPASGEFSYPAMVAARASTARSPSIALEDRPSPGTSPISGLGTSPIPVGTSPIPVGTSPLPGLGTSPLPGLGTSPLPGLGTSPIPSLGASPSPGPGSSPSPSASTSSRSIPSVSPPTATTAWRQIVLGGAVVVALAGVTVAFDLGRPLDATLAPAAQPSEVKIKFVSAPPGAEVRRAGTSEPLGVTPFTRSFPRSERAATFELAKPGFATVTQDISLAGDDAVAVALTPVSAPAPAVPALRAAPPAPPAAPKPDRPHNAVPAKPTAQPPSDRPPDRNGTMDVFKRE